MVVDKIYRNIADIVYDSDSGLEDVTHPKEEQYIIDGQYYILKIKGNLSNGMPAMVVTPIDENGNENTSQTTIAYYDSSYRI